VYTPVYGSNDRTFTSGYETSVVQPLASDVESHRWTVKPLRLRNETMSL
jgi:hypothetical protein